MTWIVFDGVEPSEPQLSSFMFVGFGKSSERATYVVADSETSATADRTCYEIIFLKI